MVTRRGFLKAILAAGAAPAIVRAEWLMPVREIVVPEFGVGILSTDALILAQRDLNRFFAQQLFNEMRRRDNRFRAALLRT